MNIVTETRSSFGNDHVYITDDKIAAAVTQLTGKKTVNNSDLDALYVLHKYLS